MSQRVVITGMGVVSPVGSTVDAFWDSLIHGRSGVRTISYFDTTNFAVKVAGEVTGFDVTQYVEAKEAKRLDKFLQYAMGAAVQAVNQSGLADSPSVDKTRVGVVIGCGIGGLGTIETNHAVLQGRGPSRVSPFFVPMSIIDMASGMVSIRYGFMGPNYGVVSACSSAGHSFIDAVNLIRLNKVDAMICGGTEGCVTPLAIAGFNSAQALSTGFNDTPSRASRPFDKNRDGFVMGEGSGILVLESLEHAKKRGANILAEISGYGMTGDAHHITAPHPDGTGSILAFREALRDGGIDASQVDYINAHGTSTPLNDKTETKVFKAVMAEHAYKVSVSSTKSMTGHMIGAAAAVEAVATVLAMQNSIVPPTINYEEPDPDCDLDVTPNVAKERSVRYALKNSLGFGGHNAAILFKRWEG
ncbi:MAG TPA: beta-ketoacyl-ACP synthase II [Fibrobacteria bacterium]|nr:beta-ketoacyl-ACP synthase II [Fibrobacteria bacterium]